MGIEVGTKYKLADKAKRNKAVIAYKEANPSATLREMAEIFGVSYVRIGKILQDNHPKS